MVHLSSSTSPAGGFESFLSASITEQENGTPVSLLSALIRSNYDPWEEAARLARLPPDRAQWALVGLLNELLGRGVAFTESENLAKALAQLLPAQEPPCFSAVETEKSRDGALLLIYWLFWIGLVITMSLCQPLNHKSSAIKRSQKESFQSWSTDSSNIKAAAFTGANEKGAAPHSSHPLNIE